MKPQPKPQEWPLADVIADLRAQLAEAKETLQAIQSGEADAVLVPGPQGDQLFTLTGADAPYRVLIEEMNQGAVTLTTDGLILYCNRRFAALLKMPLEKIVGFTFESLVAPMARTEFIRLLTAGRRGGSAGEINLLASDSCPVPLQLALGPLPANSAAAICLVATDISESKRTEERLREQADIVERARDAVIVRDFTTDCITIWNSSAQRLYGWSASEAIGRPMTELIFSESNDRAAVLAQLISTGEFRGEINHRAKDGHAVTVDARMTLIRNDDGTPRSLLGINTDITEQKKLQTQLLRAQRLENIGTLASGVAHDLNNILTPILICAETLRSDMNAEDRESALSLIEESAQRGAAVVKQVLTFARGVEGERVSITPNHLVHEMVDIAQRTFPKSIEITSCCPEDLWSLKGDPTQLHQVLLNISVNARDAMPLGGKLGFVSENFVVDKEYAATTPEAKPGPYVLLHISDTGSGMPQETIDRMFDPFFTTKELGRGTGLGLSTVVGIVKSHGGFISVHSEVGQGTIFRIFLPAEISPPGLLPKEARPVSAHGNGELVMVVDDEENILQATKRVLEKHNYRVVSASDGAEAVALFEQHVGAIKVVLTDISMPHMDGVAEVRALRKIKPDVPIIACTGEAQQARLKELQAMNVTIFLTKPFSTATLLAAVHTSIDACDGVEAECARLFEQTDGWLTQEGHASNAKQSSPRTVCPLRSEIDMDKQIIDDLLSAMIASKEGISDLLFTVGRPPLVEAYGALEEFVIRPPDSVFGSPEVEAIAHHIINSDERLTRDLATWGSCDCSYALRTIARFRVNIFKQNGKQAIVMRRLQTEIPTLEKLGLPPIFHEMIKEKNGIIFVTGATGSGKTTTLAAMLNELNQTQPIHIVTLEDPIEFLHPPRLAVFHQRELGKDFPDFARGLRAALRQAPKVILVGEIRDRETMEIAMTASETGHIVYATLHTINAGQTINRILGLFTKDEEGLLRQRLADTLRYVVSQRLVSKTGGGRLLLTEIMGSSMRTRETLLYGEGENRTFQEIIEAGDTMGWHTFDQSLLEAFEENLIDEDTALIFCAHKHKMRKDIDLVNKLRGGLFETPSGLRMEPDAYMSTSTIS